MSKTNKPERTPVSTEESAALLRLLAVIGEMENYYMLIQNVPETRESGKS